jgi:hypothetical protein
MPDFGFGRCDGHHEMVDSRLRKKPHCVPSAETASQRQGIISVWKARELGLALE